MFKNLRKINVFGGSEAPGEGQVGPKMTPSWAKMGSRSELKVIFGHLTRKMAVEVEEDGLHVEKRSHSAAEWPFSGRRRVGRGRI